MTTKVERQKSKSCTNYATMVESIFVVPPRDAAPGTLGWGACRPAELTCTLEGIRLPNPWLGRAAAGLGRAAAGADWAGIGIYKGFAKAHAQSFKGTVGPRINRIMHFYDAPKSA